MCVLAVNIFKNRKSIQVYQK